MQPSPYSAGALSGAKWNPDTFSSDQLVSTAGAMQGPTTYTPDETAMVSSQLTKLLSQDNSPYMQRVSARAAEVSNSRGLLNSSMGVQAGQAAAIDAALPIAQQDASTRFTAQRDNFNVANQFASDANNFRRQGALAAAGAGFNMFGQDRQNQFTAGQNDAQRALQREQMAADTAYRNASLGLQRDELGFRREDAQAQRNFTLTRDSQLFSQRLQEIQKLTEAELQKWDAQQGTALLNDYRTATQRTYDEYARLATEINGAELDADVKAAQLDELKSLYESKQAYTNTVFTNQPRWQGDWAQFLLEFEEA